MPKKDLEALRAKAKAGNARAAVSLGDAFYRGEGVAEDFAVARDWYTRAAELGNVDAMRNLVYFFSAGDRARSTPVAKPAPATVTELEQAVKWARAAAAKGHDMTATIADLEKRIAKEGTKSAPSTLATQRTGLEQRIVAAKLGRIGAALRATMAESLRLRLCAAPAGVGSSRLGGRPDLPARVAWPAGPKHPLSFIGQIDLAEVAVHDRTKRLPKTGLLSFFWDTIDPAWGLAVDEGARWRVLYTKKGTALAPRDPPEGLVPPHKYAKVEFVPHGVDVSVEVTLPFVRTEEFRALGATAEETSAYLEGVYEEGEGPCHRMLGHPGAIQGDMRRRIAYARAGKTAQLDKAPVAELEAEAKEYCLLLQIDTDAALGTNWGEGRLFFWIREADLRGKKFGEVWVQFQAS